MLNERSETNLVDDFVAALAAIPDVSACLEQRDERGPNRTTPDAIISLNVSGSSLLLAVEVKHSGFPRDVRDAIWKLRNAIAQLPGRNRQIVPVVVAESISPGARALLHEERVGYFDAGGSVYIPGHGSFLFIDKPAPKRAKRATQSLFKGRRALALQAVWSKGDDWFGVHELADLASVSPATVSETLTALEQREWVIVRGAGPTKERRMTGRRALLDAWTEHQKSARPQILRRFFVPTSSAGALLQRLSRVFDENGAMYAITGEAAAQTYAPYLSNISQIRCRLLAGAPSENSIRMLDARSVSEGWNLGVIDVKSQADFSFRERKDNIWFASPLQTYLDLLQFGGRSREVADHLREERLDALC